MPQKKIIKTQVNYVGIPRVDFISPDFDALVDNKGYDVIWERAIPCPCSKRQQPHSTCKNCQGVGWVFINPTQIKAVGQSINKDTQYKDWSMELLGTISLTVKSMYHLNFMDRITLLGAEVPQSENLLVKDYDGQAYANTIYSINSVIDIFEFTFEDEPLKLLIQGEDYTFEGNKVLFLKDLSEGTSVSISYMHNVQYNVLDLPHDIRQTIIMDNMSREQILKLPISAIARRSHNVLDAPNFNGDNIFDNSYLR